MTPTAFQSAFLLVRRNYTIAFAVQIIYLSAMNEFIEVCALNDIPANEPLIVEIDGNPLALCKVGDKVFALDDCCPHQGASFEGGEIDDGILICPLHGWRAEVCSGQSLEAPSLKIPMYETKVEDGKVYIKLTSEETA